MSETKLLNDYDADDVRDMVIEMLHPAHVDATAANDNVTYTHDPDGDTGWQWLNRDQLAELRHRLSADL